MRQDNVHFQRNFEYQQPINNNENLSQRSNLNGKDSEQHKYYYQPEEESSPMDNNNELEKQWNLYNNFKAKKNRIKNLTFSEVKTYFNNRRIECMKLNNSLDEEVQSF